jgi:hypothetical protein
MSTIYCFEIIRIKKEDIKINSLANKEKLSDTKLSLNILIVSSSVFKTIKISKKIKNMDSL